MSGISKSQVSCLCSELDERVGTFFSLPLDGSWPYLWLNAAYVKARVGGRVESRAVVVAVGVKSSGHREVLGIDVGPTEAEAFWTEFLRSMIQRDLSGVRLVVSDAHEGLKAAVQKLFGATWQRCKVHFIRNALASVPKQQHKMVAAIIRTTFGQEYRSEAGKAWREAADHLRSRFSKLAALMDDAEDDVLAFMAYPKEHWSQISNTNPLERLNKEIKRRLDVVGIIPNDEAVMRLVCSVLKEHTDEWQVSRCYMSQESLVKVIGPAAEPTKRIA